MLEYYIDIKKQRNPDVYAIVQIYLENIFKCNKSVTKDHILCDFNSYEMSKIDKSRHRKYNKGVDPGLMKIFQNCGDECIILGI